VIPNRGNTKFILIHVNTNMIPAIGKYNWRSKILENIGGAFLLKYEKSR
jgi:hypothetical protein